MSKMDLEMQNRIIAAVRDERERIMKMFDSYEVQTQAEALALRSEGLPTDKQAARLESIRFLREVVAP